MPAFEASQPERHVLAAGQQLSLRVRAGSTVHVRRGSVTLSEPPRWVGETVLRLQARLGEAQLHTCSEGGWVSLQAGAERSELWCHAPQATTATRWWPLRSLRSLRSLWATAVAAVRGSGLRSAGGC
jgi:hypothetical protein